MANLDGIRLNTQKTNNRDTLFDWNVIGSNENDKGPSYGIYCVASGADDEQTAMVHNNTIAATLDCIKGFPTWRVIGNMISLNGDAPASETGHNT